VAAEDRSGSATRYKYTEHRLVAVTNRRGGTIFFQYDNHGRGVARWRSDGSRYRYIERDPEARRIRLVNSFGYQWVWELNEQGKPTKKTDPLHRTLEDVYDNSGNLIFSSLNVVGPPCISQWDQATRCAKLICGGSEMFVFFNEMDKPIRMVDARGNVYTYEYDAKGHLTRQMLPGGGEFRFAYTARGELAEMSDPAGNMLRIHRDLFAVQLEDRLGPISNYTLDLFGNLTSLTVPESGTMRLAYDAAGNLAQILWPDGGEVQVRYDPEGNPVEVIHPGGARVQMASDLFGRPTAITDPNGGTFQIIWNGEGDYTTLRNANGAEAVFRYDPVDRLVEVGHFDGHRTCIEYDDQDRPTRYVNPDTGTETRYSYNDLDEIAERSCTRGLKWTYAFGPQGELNGAESVLGTWAYEWTPMLSLAAETNPDRELVYTRDALSRRTSFQDSLGLRIDYEWDIRSRLTALTINGRWRYEFGYNGHDLCDQPCVARRSGHRPRLEDLHVEHFQPLAPDGGHEPRQDSLCR
jgi:YD repeat-containing protein